MAKTPTSIALADETHALLAYLKEAEGVSRSEFLEQVIQIVGNFLPMLQHAETRGWAGFVLPLEPDKPPRSPTMGLVASLSFMAREMMRHQDVSPDWIDAQPDIMTAFVQFRLAMYGRAGEKLGGKPSRNCMVASEDVGYPPGFVVPWVREWAEANGIKPVKGPREGGR